MLLRPRRSASAAAVLGAMVALAPAACGGGSPGAGALPSARDAGFEPPRVGAVARVWAVGDAAGPGDPPKRVARTIAAGRPELLLYLGDVYPLGTAKDFTIYDGLFGRLARRTAPTIGNHEWPLRRSGYDRYWRRALGRPLPSYYSFRAAGWTVLGLNSELASAQMRRQASWLRRRAAGSGNCRLAFWHRPRYSAGLHGDSPRVDPLWNALRGRARLVLNGHEHAMQHYRRRDGITELVTGAGGNGRYPLHADMRRAWGDDGTDGALRLTLRPGRASFAFVAAGGRVLHRGSVRCRAS